jgi:WD40 repeat protein
VEIRLLPGGKRVVTLNGQRELHVWDVKQSPPFHVERLGDARISGVAVADQPPALVFAEPTRHLEIWNAESLQLDRRIPRDVIGGYVGGLAISPDSRMLAICCHGQVVLLELQTEAVIGRVDVADAIWPLTFSPDGSMLLVGITGQGGSILQVLRVADTRIEELVEQLDTAGRLDAAGDELLSACFSRDGLRAAVFASPPSEMSTPDSIGEVFLYCTSSWALLWHVVLDARFTGRIGERTAEFRVSDGTDIAFTASGAHIVCGGDEGTLFVLDARDGSLVRRVTLLVGHRVITFAIDHDHQILWTANRNALLKVPLEQVIP